MDDRTMTKRELIAAMAMHAIVSRSPNVGSLVAKTCVEYADSLLSALSPPAQPDSSQDVDMKWALDKIDELKAEIALLRRRYEGELTLLEADRVGIPVELFGIMSADQVCSMDHRIRKVREGRK